MSYEAHVKNKIFISDPLLIKCKQIEINIAQSATEITTGPKIVSNIMQTIIQTNQTINKVIKIAITMQLIRENIKTHELNTISKHVLIAIKVVMQFKNALNVRIAIKIALQIQIKTLIRLKN
jgi:hypothetical protein